VLARHGTGSLGESCVAGGGDLGESYKSSGLGRGRGSRGEGREPRGEFVPPAGLRAKPYIDGRRRDVGRKCIGEQGNQGARGGK
jgi:hypothetical protein